MKPRDQFIIRGFFKNLFVIFNASIETTMNKKPLLVE